MEFLLGKICLFRADTFTMWVDDNHRQKLVKAVVEKGRAATENIRAPCVVRKETPITTNDAYKLLETCDIESVVVMQYGQKADFDNNVVQWALDNVRASGVVVVVGGWGGGG
jgi:hypothetical protein